MADSVADGEAERWSQAIQAHLRRVAPSIVPGAPSVQDIRPLAPDVWLLHMHDGGRVVAKHQLFGLLTHDEPFDLLRTEFDALRALRQEGASVPVPFGIDSQGQFIFIEYVGDRTLFEALVVDGETECIRHAVNAQIRIEQVLAGDPKWQGRVIPGAERHELAISWHAVEDLALRGLARSLNVLGSTATIEKLQPMIRALHERLGARSVTLGATDYQPRNIMCDRAGPRIAFLEQGKLGWDWTERRALQYTTPLECGDLSLASKWDFLQELVGSFTEVDARRALDAHHLFFRLVLAARDPRMADLDLLRQPLSDDPAMVSFRRHLRESRLNDVHRARELPV